MKKLLLFIVVVQLFAGCKKENVSCQPPSVSAPSIEMVSLERFIAANNITAVKYKESFYYTINQEGDGMQPNACSNIKVNYKGNLPNNSKFDEGNGSSFNLSNVIDGWKIGIPLIKEGGNITLYLPPSLGYGSKSVGNIPPNSILIFNVELLEVIK